ncbi:hypothetical protein D6T64_03415 [Cryobacterium melibiosiphilum]|uniref:Uncharacterized protein n=1 Tax=Cryobacterium melibiosiphilum TaxID=995039 RepID=A0A3A5MKP9_9MICO|nr:hypothetical protein [Cryobacterium melibiosiphilum]RJT90680.1 hypothetical protein D6T64_03415 [Cryobacterium melibiosiphilum]
MSPRPFARNRSRLTLFAATALIVLGTLSGCSNAPAALEPATADRLQASVLDVTSAAAAGDYETALSLLSAVEADLRTSASAGQITAERSAEIQAAITVVNADLLAAVEASVPEPVPTRSATATPTPTPTPTPSESPSPTPSPTPTSDDDDEDDDNKGKNDDKECKPNDDDDKDGICNDEDDDD